MMFGSGECFDYVECSACGCLQLSSWPADLSRYYGSSYYSYGTPRSRARVIDWLYAQRDGYAFTGKGALGRALHAIYPKPEFRFLARLPIAFDARILDVGCGAGVMLTALSRAGFRNLHGVDPFVANDIRYPGGVQIRRCSLADVHGTYDVIMFNHSLEHMEAQVETLRMAARRLASGGTVIVRIPTVSSWAWQAYRTHWAQIDAPRHLFVHSTTSFARVAAESGLRIVDRACDSNAFQFWGSELYRRGISLQAHAAGAGWSPSAGAMRTWEREAARLNGLDQGDQAAFYLRAG